MRIAFFGKPDAAAYWAAQAAEALGVQPLPDPRERARKAALADRVGFSNLWAAALRIVDASEREGVVVSGSCVLDEVGVQGIGFVRLKQEVDWLNATAPTLEDADGKPLLTPEAAKRTGEVQTASNILQVLAQQAVEESEFWDYLYFCRFAGDEVVDGLGEGSGEAVDRQIEFVVKATRVAAFQRIVELPADEAAAAKVFDTERSRW